MNKAETEEAVAEPLALPTRRPRKHLLMDA
jgi:hypothetical protein